MMRGCLGFWRAIPTRDHVIENENKNFKNGVMLKEIWLCALLRFLLLLPFRLLVLVLVLVLEENEKQLLPNYYLF